MDDVQTEERSGTYTGPVSQFKGVDTKIEMRAGGTESIDDIINNYHSKLSDHELAVELSNVQDAHKDTFSLTENQVIYEAIKRINSNEYICRC